MWVTWVLSLGWEDPLEKGEAGYPPQYSGLENSMDSMGSQRVGRDLSDFFFFSLSYLSLLYIHSPPLSYFALHYIFHPTSQIISIV